MKIKHYAIEFAIMFAVVFVVNLIVTYLYGLIVHGAGTMQWESAITFAISLGIVLTWVHRQEPGVK